MPKRIVVCLDGTWNRPEREPDGDIVPTNVLKLVRALKPTAQNGAAQVVFYDWGVGTGGRLDRLKGGMFGIGLSQNILDAYRFIANNYDDGDEIYCFGFSRGAFTARSLGGMIGAVGLLRKQTMNRLPEAFAYYRVPPAARGTAQAERLRASLGAVRPCRIRFIGVWDTVGALGIPVTWLRWVGARRHHFHDVSLGAHVDHAYHALAIDERRGPFEPTLWARGPARHPGQHVEQMWFCGAHADVGGGRADARLSDIALLWLVEKAEACGLAFDRAYLAACTNPDPQAPVADSRTGAYRWLRPHHRHPLEPETHLNHTVHPSVVERYRQADRSHLPQALRLSIEARLTMTAGTARPRPRERAQEKPDPASAGAMGGEEGRNDHPV